MLKEVTVRYLSLPDIKDGVSSFYEHYFDHKCTEPSQSYSSGRCHTSGDERDELAVKAGFMTRREYAAQRKSQNFSSWKNAYGYELSLAFGDALESEGIVWTVNGEDILFRCPKGEFVAWPWKKNLKIN